MNQSGWLHLVSGYWWIFVPTFHRNLQLKVFVTMFKNNNIGMSILLQGHGGAGSTVDVPEEPTPQDVCHHVLHWGHE